MTARAWAQFEEDGEFLLEFSYTNYRGEHHEYVIDLEAAEVGPYDAGGVNRDASPQLVLHGCLVTRDGDPRPELAVRRRTFLASGLRDLRLVRRST